MHHINKMEKECHDHFDKSYPDNLDDNINPPRLIVPASAIEFNIQFICIGINVFRTSDLLISTESPKARPYENHISHPTAQAKNENK